jgi:hypothetical protein
MNSMLLFLSMYHIKVSPVPNIFSFIVDISCHFIKIAPIEKMHRKG